MLRLNTRERYFSIRIGRGDLVRQPKTLVLTVSKLPDTFDLIRTDKVEEMDVGTEI